MRIWEIEFHTGTHYIVFAPNRQTIRKRYSGVIQIHEVIIS